MIATPTALREAVNRWSRCDTPLDKGGREMYIGGGLLVLILIIILLIILL